MADSSELTGCIGRNVMNSTMSTLVTVSFNIVKAYSVHNVGNILNFDFIFKSSRIGVLLVLVKHFCYVEICSCVWIVLFASGCLIELAYFGCSF